MAPPYPPLRILTIPDEMKIPSLVVIKVPILFLIIKPEVIITKVVEVSHLKDKETKTQRD